MRNLIHILLMTTAAIGLLVGDVDAQTKKKSCKSSLAACPTRGCETAGTPHALMNELKRAIGDGGR